MASAEHRCAAENRLRITDLQHQGRLVYRMLLMIYICRNSVSKAREGIVRSNQWN
jgi:hypothetical protein